jgi:hypothetical protein
MGMLLVHFPMKYISLAYHSSDSPLIENYYGHVAGSFPNEIYFMGISLLGLPID